MGRRDRDRHDRSHDRPNRDRSFSPRPMPRDYHRHESPPPFRGRGRSRSVSPPPRRGGRDRSRSRDRGIGPSSHMGNGRSLIDRIGSASDAPQVPLASRIGRQDLPPPSRAGETRASWPQRDPDVPAPASPKPKFRPIGQRAPPTSSNNHPPPPLGQVGGRGRKKSFDDDREDRKRPRTEGWATRCVLLSVSLPAPLPLFFSFTWDMGDGIKGRVQRPPDAIPSVWDPTP